MGNPAAEGKAERVIRLTELVGSPVRAADGSAVGRVADVLAGVEDPYPAVCAVAVARQRRSRPVLYEAGDFQRLEPGDLVLKEGAAAARPSGHELWLARDVLDVRLVDVDNRRIARAGEVDMARSGDTIRVMAIEVGWRAIVRRLGLRRLAGGIERDSVDWAAVHLASGAGRVLQLSSPGAAVHRLDPDELAELLSILPVAAGSELLGSVAGASSAAALARVHPELGADLVEALDPDRAAKLLAAMSDEEAERALASADPERRRLLFEQLGEPRRHRIEQLAADRRRDRAPAPGRFWNISRGHGRRA